MRYARLQWIANAIEYDRLTTAEAKAFYNFVEKFMQDRATKGAEEKLEHLFAEVQWREDKEAVLNPSIPTREELAFWDRKLEASSDQACTR
jgi:hypothetical protein